MEELYDVWGRTQNSPRSSNEECTVWLIGSGKQAEWHINWVVDPKILYSDRNPASRTDQGNTSFHQETKGDQVIGDLRPFSRTKWNDKGTAKESHKI